MKKVWVFVEGDTEAIFISYLIRQKLYKTFLQEKDVSVFIKEDPRDCGYHKIYCENCGSVDKIPHRINEMYYQIEASRSRRILVVCDVEKLKCYSKRKELIETKLDEQVDKSFIRYVFFNPMIESSYWQCPWVIEKIVELAYKEKFGSPKDPKTFQISFKVDNSYSHSQEGLKRYFKKFNLKYRETWFADKFFPRVDFEECPNHELSRVLGFLESI
jgi:hypothetical protein